MFVHLTKDDCFSKSADCGHDFINIDEGIGNQASKWTFEERVSRYIKIKIKTFRLYDYDLILTILDLALVLIQRRDQ